MLQTYLSTLHLLIVLSVGGLCLGSKLYPKHFMPSSRAEVEIQFEDKENAI